jgi:hypothetical protein
MYWDITVAAEYYHVFIFIVSIVAYRTLSIILSNHSHVRVRILFFLILQNLSTFPALLKLL